MKNFFNVKNNQNKIFIYILVSKISNNEIISKILLTKTLIPHEYSFIINNFNNFNNEIIDKIILNYKFNKTFPNYPYDLFYLNRVLLHSFLYCCDKYNNLINYNETNNETNNEIKIHFISNINYLKRIKDWSIYWKKNNFTIDKFQGNIIDENLYSIYILSQHYFNFELLENNTYICNIEDRTEKILERPNADLIKKCLLYFDEQKFKFL